MSDQATAAAPAPPIPERVIRARSGLVPINFSDLYRYRELLLFLTWRDILIRYKQTAIGVLWAIIQPVLTTVIFTFIFSRMAKLPSGGQPYPLMVFAGLLPWQLFANAISESSNSVVSAGQMVSKIYFPRLIIPAASTMSGLVDLMISMVLLMLMMMWYGVSFHARLLVIPLFIFVAITAAFGAGLWLSSLNVKYRDVRFVVPFIVRMGFYVSPVGFNSSIVPEKWRFLYCLNPMVGVIDGFRWAILGPEFAPYWPGFCVSLAVIAAMLVSGAYYFRYSEKTFADVI